MKKRTNKRMKEVKLRDSNVQDRNKYNITLQRSAINIFSEPSAIG